MVSSPDSSNPGPVAGLTQSLAAALGAGTREAFVALLTEDVRWGGERRGGGDECTDRSQAGESYAGLLEAGVRLSVADLQQVDPDDDTVFTAHLQVTSPDPDDFPERIAVRLTLREGLICDISILDGPSPSIELLFVDDCPQHEELLAHIQHLLAEHDITTPIGTVLVSTEEEAQRLRFPGSPTVRVDGLDIEPAVADRAAHLPDVAYGLQCRLYYTPDGSGLTGMPQQRWLLDALVDDPTHVAAVEAIHTGDTSALQRLLTSNPELATARLRRRGGRTLLHVATDWPGHLPNITATITMLIEAGANPNTTCLGESTETPLHWAASSDDLEALDALLDGGADINAPGAVIAGGTPMADATAFGQWNAARRLHERGARTNLFEAAALGLTADVQEHLDTGRHTAEDITSSFWGACHGGRRSTAALLLERGADLNWVGYDELTPLDAARRAEAPEVISWLEGQGATSACEPQPERHA